MADERPEGGTVMVPPSSEDQQQYVADLIRWRVDSYQPDQVIGGPMPTSPNPPLDVAALREKHRPMAGLGYGQRVCAFCKTVASDPLLINNPAVVFVNYPCDTIRALDEIELQRGNWVVLSEQFVIEQIRAGEAETKCRELTAQLHAAQAELEKVRYYYEHMLSWQVTCKGCADSLDKSYEAYCSEEVTKMRELADEHYAKLTAAQAQRREQLEAAWKACWTRERESNQHWRYASLRWTNKDEANLSRDLAQLDKEKGDG